MKKKQLPLLILAFVVVTSPLLSQALSSPDSAIASLTPPAPAGNITVTDYPNDNGHGISVQWQLSPDDSSGRMIVSGYEVDRSESPDAPDSLWVKRGTVLKGVANLADRGARDRSAGDYFPKGVNFYYRVKALSPEGTSFSATAGPIQAKDDWFNTGRTVVVVFVGVFLLLTVIFVQAARKGRELYVRPLAGIEAIDEAIGRATEMGKPILYVLGLGTAADIATIASFTILGRVAKRVAEYQTPIIVPCRDPIVMTVAQETVKTGYSDAGRPDTYQEDSVYYLTDNQFAYVAGVNGMMVREKPATNLYLGKFFAESLMLAETGVIAGSIQIAGTDEIAQLPFFVVACDYTLIGEELYAASAYLGREPLLLGSLKAQDWAKGIVILTIILGIVVRYGVSMEFVRRVLEITS